MGIFNLIASVSFPKRVVKSYKFTTVYPSIKSENYVSPSNGLADYKYSCSISLNYEIILSNQ